MDSLEKPDASASTSSSRNPFKSRSISLNTTAALTQVDVDRLRHSSLVKRHFSTDEYGHFHAEFHKTSSYNNVSTIVLSKLRSFGRQIHRHMIETVNVTNDVSRGIPRSAVGDIYFHNSSTLEFIPSKHSAKHRRSKKLSLDLEETQRYLKIIEISDNLNEDEQSSSTSKLTGSTHSKYQQNELGSIRPRVSTGRRLSISAPELKAVNKCQENKKEEKQNFSVREESKKSVVKMPQPREVSYDDQGQTWEIYGADQDPNALGQAIESHLEKMMQRKQREQRCFSLGNEILRQNTNSTKSSSRASHTGEQIFQAARRRFRRRAVSSVTSNSTNANTTEESPDRLNRGKRSRLLSYISRILRRSSTSAIVGRRHNLMHQNSILESNESRYGVEKVMVSAN